MSEPPITTSGVSPVQPAQTPQTVQAAYAMVQVEAQEAFDGTQDVAFNPLLLSQKQTTLESRRTRGREETSLEKLEKQEEQIANVEAIEAAAEKFEEQNPELQRRTLVFLRAGIKKGDSHEEILRKLGEIYLDQALKDEALEFLIETTEDQELQTTLREVKENLNLRFGREIRAGRNMGEQARAFSSQLGSPTALRDMYRDITANPRETLTLFDELNQKFSYEKMQTAVEFLFHSLGSDLKSKGPSISKGELHRLVTETRALQAILGIYRFFQSRMKQLFLALQKLGIIVSSRFTFINLAKQFCKLLQEKYPNLDKILILGGDYGFLQIETAQVLLLSLYRDGLRQVAPRLFRSEKHKHDLSVLLAMALDKLYKQIEEKEDEKQKKEKKKEKKKEDD